MSQGRLPSCLHSVQDKSKTTQLWGEHNDHNTTEFCHKDQVNTSTLYGHRTITVMLYLAITFLHSLSFAYCADSLTGSQGRTGRNQNSFSSPLWIPLTGRNTCTSMEHSVHSFSFQTLQNMIVHYMQYIGSTLNWLKYLYLAFYWTGDYRCLPVKDSKPGSPP